MNPFKSKGFDTLIASGTTLEGVLILASGSTTIVDGNVSGDSIKIDSSGTNLEKTTLVINGIASTLKSIEVPNVTITGHVTCDVLDVSGILAIKKGAFVRADKIRYSTLVVETGAVIHGTLEFVAGKVNV